MKIKSLLYVLLLALVPAVFTACNDDKDEPDDQPIWDMTQYTGYFGALEASVNGTHCDFDGDYEVIIHKENSEATKVSVTLPQCSFTIPGTQMNQTIPSLKVENVTREKGKDGIKLSKSETAITLEGVQYTVVLEGTMTATGVTLNYSLQPGKMPMVINFSYKGLAVYSASSY